MILLIDNYDSFTFNVYQYMGLFEKNIKVIRNDELTLDEIKRLRPNKIILSPGPKTPNEAGVCIDVIKQFAGGVPILGICLGHQCVGQAFGGSIGYATTLFHGKQSDIHLLKKEKIFEGIEPIFKAARYHSLVIKKENFPNDLDIIATTKEGEIMAVKHKSYNIYGLQFHPESIYTPDGITIIKNFIEKVHS